MRFFQLFLTISPSDFDVPGSEMLKEAPESLFDFLTACLASFTGLNLYSLVWIILGFLFVFAIIRRVINIVS